MKKQIISSIVAAAILCSCNSVAMAADENYSDDEFHQYIEQAVCINLYQGETRTFTLPDCCEIVDTGDFVLTDLGNNEYSLYAPVTNRLYATEFEIDCYHTGEDKPDTEHYWCPWVQVPTLTLSYSWTNAPDGVELPADIQNVGKYDNTPEHNERTAEMLSAFANYKNDFTNESKVEVDEGTYTFSGWTLNGTTFEGSWDFAAVEPIPDPEPEPDPDIDPTPTPDIDPEPTPDPEPEPDPDIDPTPTPDIDPEPTPQDNEEQIIPTSEIEENGNILPTGDIDIIDILLIALIALCVYVILIRLIFKD